MTKITENGPITYDGTFRHMKCTGSIVWHADKDADMCEYCSRIPSLESFKRRLLLRQDKSTTEGERDATKFRFDYLTKTEKLKKLRDQAQELEKKTSEIFFLQSKNLRLQLKTRSIKEKLEEFSRRGDMKAITHKLCKAHKKGLFKDKNVLLDTIETVSRNLNVIGKTGKRYKASVKEFYEVLLIWGGPRLASFVSMNLHGPDLSSIYTWRKLKTISITSDSTEKLFHRYADMYKQIKFALGIKGQVPCLLAEDETAIKGELAYSQTSDELLGFCGEKTENPKDHVCFQDFNIVIGNDIDSYEKMRLAFEHYTVGKFARAILINPLHEHLPRLVALLRPTCNRFTHLDVYRQWTTIEQHYDATLQQSLGPLIGHSSDGDSRRRKLMMQLMSVDLPPLDTFQPISSDLGFSYKCRKVNTEHGYMIKQIGDQDAIHEHKKLINPLDHPTRILQIGPGLMVHMHHINLIVEHVPVIEHGLNKDHILRRDRQNWKHAQELTFLKVQSCLQRLINGTYEDFPTEPILRGTHAYLKLVWHYVEIFFSPVATLYTRIKYAGFFVTFLGIWRNFVNMHPGMNLRSSFITRESYIDGMISAHFAVMLIVYFRDNFPYLECRLDLTGSDCCEIFFSRHGQWVGNRHNFNFGDMHRNVSHMIRLEQIQCDPDGPKFARNHIKQENVWHKQYDMANIQKVDLTNYPPPGDEVKAWKEGIEMAQQLARDLGMLPNFFHGGNDGPDDPDNDWFYRPFKDPSDLMEKMMIEEDLCKDVCEEPVDEKDDDSANHKNGKGKYILKKSRKLLIIFYYNIIVFAV